MVDVVKSIFRQREVIGEYINGIYPSSLSWFQGTENVVSDNLIGEYDIEIPILEEGELFFLSDINRIVKIKSRMRSSNGAIVYYDLDKIVSINDVETNKLGDYIYKIKYEEIKNNFNKLIEKFNDYKKEYKYKHRFFNFKQNKVPNDKSCWN